jgi:hypothetical protein
MPHIKKLTEDLRSFFQSYEKGPFTQNVDPDDLIEAELNWGLHFLYAQIWRHSTLAKNSSISISTLTEIYNDYNKKTGFSCDLDKLFQRKWLRFINYKVKVASTIMSISKSWDNFLENEQQIRFIFWTKEHTSNGSFSIDEFGQLASKFSETYNCEINIKDLIKANLISQNGERITAQNYNYYEPFLLYKNDLSFIKYFLETISANVKSIIGENHLDQIFKEHQERFPQIPPINFFLEKGFFRNEGNLYSINYHLGLYPFPSSLQEKAGLLFWRHLCSDATFETDQERITIWYEKVIASLDWCSIRIFPPKEKDRFLNAALELLLNDPDFGSGEAELDKLFLDQRHGRENLALTLSPYRRTLAFPDEEEIFKQYVALEELNDYQQGLLDSQSLITELNYFIQEIVLFDSESAYCRIIALLEKWKEKPYLFWETANNILKSRPSVIPFLLTKSNTISFGFRLLEKYNPPVVFRSPELRPNETILKKGFNIVCLFLKSSINIGDRKQARIILQCLYGPTLEKFKIIRPDSVKHREQKVTAIRISDSLRQILCESITLGRPNHINTDSNSSWCTSLLPYFMERGESIDYEYIPSYVGLSLPFYRLDFYIWLSSLFVSAKKNGSIDESVIDRIWQDFLDAYLNCINTRSVQIWTDKKEQFMPEIPTWIHEKQNIAIIDWATALPSLEEYKLLTDFLTPRELYIKKTDHLSDKFNRFTAYKIRTHLSLLLVAYSQLYKKASARLGFEPLHKSVLSLIENSITNFVTKYCVNKPEIGRIDIFSEHFEKSFWSDADEELLPLVSSTLNRFSNENREKIVAELLKENQVVRALTLLDGLTSEKDKEILYQLLKAQDIESFFLTVKSRDEAVFVLTKLASNNEFVLKARDALQIWRASLIRGGHTEVNRHAILCFRTELLLAYHNLNEEEVARIEPPELLEDHTEWRAFNANEDKSFYIGLILFQRGKGQEAYQIFNSLLEKAQNDRPVLALNRFASGLKWAEKIEKVKDRKAKYGEVLKEWDEFERELSKEFDISFLEDNIYLNKLEAYSVLEMHSAFDSLFDKLEEPLQLRSHFLELRIKNLVARNMQQHAEMLLSTAEEFHRLADGNLPEVIIALRRLTDTDESLKKMQEQYRRIISKPAEDLIKIIPPNISKYYSLYEYLLDELVSSAGDMLDYINSISEITSEDKFSDLMTLAFRNRIAPLGWKTGPARGGYPESAKQNLGLIDCAIYSNKDRLAICEAFQLSGTNLHVEQTHNFKIFNYDPARKAAFIIIYYNGPGGKFDKYWNTYLNDIAERIKFPKNFELSEKGICDLSERFGTNSIKAARSDHESQVTIFHIFININYRVELNAQ